MRALTFKILLRTAAPAEMVLLWVLSSRPLNLPDLGGFGVDKIAHFLAYAALAVALSLWFSPEEVLEKKYISILIVVVLASLYGAVDEIHQSFVPGRDADFFDLLADIFGALAGAWTGFRVAGSRLSQVEKKFQVGKKSRARQKSQASESDTT